MIHCIVGHGASGKTTIQNYLKFKIPAITTYTTRPIRHNETDGVHYHFLTNAEFELKMKNDFFIEHYYIPENQWYYGLSLKGLWYEIKDFTLVLDPKGYKTLLEKLGNKYLRCYYINVNEHDRIVRMAKRKDNVEEIFRRILSDRKDFEGFSTYADVILQSMDSRKNAQIILEKIKERAL